MRTFELLDGSRRNAQPCALVTYDEDAREFSIDITEDTHENDVPMMLQPFVQRGVRHLDPLWSRRWVQERIVPPSRQNIGQVLKAHEMDSYDEFPLLLSSEGRCAQDDFYLREIETPVTEVATSKSLMHELGEQLAEIRAEEGLTQAELSRRTGIQQAVISRLERGEGNPTLDTLEALALGLNRHLAIHLDSLPS